MGMSKLAKYNLMSVASGAAPDQKVLHSSKPSLLFILAKINGLATR